MTRLRPLMLCVAALMAVLSLSAVPDIERIDSSATVTHSVSSESRDDDRASTGAIDGRSRRIGPSRTVPAATADRQATLSTFRI